MSDLVWFVSEKYGYYAVHRNWARPVAQVIREWELRKEQERREVQREQERIERLEMVRRGNYIVRRNGGRP